MASLEVIYCDCYIRVVTIALENGIGYDKAMKLGIPNEIHFSFRVRFKVFKGLCFKFPTEFSCGAIHP